MGRLDAAQTTEMQSLIGNAIRDRKIKRLDGPRYEAMYHDNAAMVRQLLAGPVEAGGLMAGLIPEEPVNNSEYPKEWISKASNTPTGGVVFEEETPGLAVTQAQPTVADSQYPKEWTGNAGSIPNVPPPGGGHVTREEIT
ncbi:MAG: hypothetical protein WAP35_05100 [Solirubrobacterales bacterium]